VVVPVEEVDAESRRLVLPRLLQRGASGAAAEEFGRRLAATHAAGAPWFGCPPPGWEHDGYIGPIPLPHNTSGEQLPWGEFFARYRLEPFLRAARDGGALSASGGAAVTRVCRRLAGGDGDLCGPAEPVARLHGDLWSGNVLWTAAGAVLIDPAAHGGHRESDLAMLQLFGAPHLQRILAAYHEAAPLADGWRQRVGLHQVFPLLVHAVLFGPGYGAQAAEVAARYA
jgi:fructosamine-3-kinase